MVALFTSSDFLKPLVIPPEQRAAFEAVKRVLDRLPSEWREAVLKLRFFSAPYVVCALYDSRLDDPRISAAARRTLLAAREEARAALKTFKAANRLGSRPRGAPPAGALPRAVLEKARSRYRQLVAASTSKGRDDIWRQLNREIGYSNWKTLRKLVNAQLRSM